MNVVILAGGFGTRLSEYTEMIPKPLVKIGSKPMLVHIMQRYAKYGFNDFTVALGYKGELIKEYFLNYKTLNSNLMIDFAKTKVEIIEPINIDWRVKLIDTGLHTMTGGRLKRLQKYIGEQTFMLTYGDGIADIDLDQLLNFHKSHGKMITMTAVRPGARFGELEIDGVNVSSFKEKPQLHEGWINGGFFIIEPEFFQYIDGDTTLLEREPLERLVKMGQLVAFKHDGFWQCMDSKRDVETLENLWNSGAPWL